MGLINRNGRLAVGVGYSFGALAGGQPVGDQFQDLGPNFYPIDYQGIPSSDGTYIDPVKEIALLEPNYPDMVLRRQAPIYSGMVGPVLVIVAALTPLPQPRYPDRLDRPRVLLGDGAIAPPFQPPVVTTPWTAAYYPDRLAPPTPPLSGGASAPPYETPRARVYYPDRLAPPLRSPEAGSTAPPIDRSHPLAWKPVYPDRLDRPRVLIPSDAIAPPYQIPFQWRVRYPDWLVQPRALPPSGPVAPPYQTPFVRALYPDRLGQLHALPPSGVIAPPYQTPQAKAYFPDHFALRQHPILPTSTAPFILLPPLSWQAIYPSRFARPRYDYHTGEVPSEPILLPGQTMAIFVPDETPIGLEMTISVEYLIGGAPVPYDAPPTVRVYHLDALGNEVIDLPVTVMTQYGANPSYFANWTPAAKGTYMVDVRGTVAGQGAEQTQAITVRPKFDPDALALQGIFVSRM